MAEYDPWEDPGGPGGNPSPSAPYQPPTGKQPNGTWGTYLDENGNGDSSGPIYYVDENEYNRRLDLNIANNRPRSEPVRPGAGSGPGGATPRPDSYRHNPGPVPVFTAPKFTFDEQFRYPTFEEAQNEPGFQFQLQNGLGALQNSAAARGTLRGGATLKALNDYAQNFAAQGYGNVANRALQGFQTRRDTAQQAWENLFRGSQAEFAPRLVGWQTNAQLGDNALNRQWDAFRWDNLSARDLLDAITNGTR
jgi:hypothetical protein